MPNVKLISELQNYSEAPRDVPSGSPVGLAEGGCYAIVNLKEYDRTRATLQLMNELAQGRRSGEEGGWLSPEEARAHFHERARKG